MQRRNSRGRSQVAPEALESKSARASALTTEEEETYMRRALALAREGAREGEVPVGAVLVDAETRAVVGEARNACEQSGDPTAHAEMTLIREGAKTLGGWRALQKVRMYITVEPCAMCAGAILQSRVGGVTYGAKNPSLGADGSWVAMMRKEDVGAIGRAPNRPHPFMPELDVRGGVLAEECSALMSDFFKRRRTMGSYGDGVSEDETSLIKVGGD